MKVALLDENIEQRNSIFNCISECGVNVEVRAFDKSFALVSYIYDELRGNIDLIIIHISSSHDSAIRMAAAVQGTFPHVKVIFCSDNSDCAEKIFDAKPTYFLLLPLDRKRLKRALERVEENIEENRENSLMLQIKGVFHWISYNSIKYIESVGRKIVIYTNDNIFETNMTMDDIIQKLPDYFSRCHRSYIINLHRVKSLSSESVKLTTNELIAVSRLYKHEVIERVSK